MWLDPGTAAKLVVLPPAEVLPTLTTLIDLDNIPTKLGGDFNFTQGMIPDVDEGIGRALVWEPASRKSLPPGPLKWSVDSVGRKVAVAVGSVDGKPRVETIAVLNPLGDTDGGPTVEKTSERISHEIEVEAN